jgi:anti-sigma-K factor RskA
MKDSLHIADAELALYAIGALSAAEMDSVQRHLQACARCTEELRQYTVALAAYAQTTPETALPAGANERFMARLAATPQTSLNASPAPAPAKKSIASAQPGKAAFSWRRIFGTAATGWTPVLMAAFAILLLVVGADDLRKRAEIGPLLAQAQRGALDSAKLAQLMELLGSPQAKNVALHQAPVTSSPPEGRVVYSAHSGKLLLTAQNLRPLPSGKTYELWILQPGGKAPLPAGTFAPDSSGNAAMILADEPANLAVQGFGVTIENEGGSQTPTLPIVLSGL